MLSKAKDLLLPLFEVVIPAGILLLAICYPSPVANPEHLALFKGRVSDWNRWRQENPAIQPDLSGAGLEDEYMPEANLSQANLRGSDLRRINLRGAKLVNASLQKADLWGADLRQADLTTASLKEARLVRANLHRASLSRTALQSADLRWANLRGADLRHANLEFATLQCTDLREADMRISNLCSAKAQEACLSDANLRFADLTSINLTGASLFHTNLDRAVLTHANLSETNLCKAILTRADLRFADLTSAELIEADLGRADLTQSTLHATNFHRATLTDCKLWETLRAGWGIRAVMCERIFWDKDGEKATEYVPGEFERIYSDQSRIELFYEGGLSAFELGTLPALLQHLASLHPGTNILLKTIEQTGGGAKITLSLGSADEQTKEKIEADAVQVVRAQLRLREDETLRLQIENATLKQMHETTIRLMLTSAAPQITFNAPVHTAALPMGNARVEIHQTFNDPTELIQLIDKLLTRNTELTTTQSEEVEEAKAELQKPAPDKPALKRSLEFLKDLATEAIKKGAGKLGERAASTDWAALQHQLTQFIHHLS